MFNSLTGEAATEMRFATSPTQPPPPLSIMAVDHGCQIDISDDNV
jgi:hypothetical protein